MKCGEGWWDRRTEEFRTERGVGQECPMSSILFNLYIMDLEEEMNKEQTGGVIIGKVKFWTWTYADNRIPLAKNEKDSRSMLKRFRKYLTRKGIILSAGKSKVMVFEKGRGRKKKREWRWGEESIEEVKEIKYLGYMTRKNGGVEKQVRDR